MVALMVVLANLEGINAEFIRQGISQSERLLQLIQIAITQMQSLLGNTLSRINIFCRGFCNELCFAD